MKNVATKVEGEKLLSLYHPFDTQMNEGMNNAVSRRCPKNKVFAGSGGLKYRVASVAGQQTQGVTKYNKDVYKRCGMKMSQWQESSGNRRKSDGTMVQPTRRNSIGKGNKTKRNEKFMLHDLKLSNKKGRTIKLERLTALGWLY